MHAHQHAASRDGMQDAGCRGCSSMQHAACSHIMRCSTHSANTCFGGTRGGTLNSTPFFGGKRDTQYSTLDLNTPQPKDNIQYSHDHDHDTSPLQYYSKNKTPALSIAFFLEAGECSSEGMYDYGDFISPSLLAHKSRRRSFHRSIIKSPSSSSSTTK